MNPTTHDRAILRRLAEQQAAVACLPVQREKAELWRRLNDLEPVRPLVWITEIPWHEMNTGDELTLQCEDAWARQIETGLRRLLYQWRHMPGDMIVDDYIASPLIIHSTGYGLSEDVDIRRTDAGNDIVSRHFHRQIVEPGDIAKIQMPVVTCDRQASEAEYQARQALFGDILPVRRVGKKFIWCAPWDELIRWWGVEDAMRDLVDRPEMVEAAITRLIDAYLCELDQWAALGLLSCNADNVRVGSGGYGYTGELPTPKEHPGPARPAQMWGNATAQIFGSVSPRMHWEFALKHELRWLERWGLTYYGCCEPLDGKLALLRRIPNLRKISMSPWVNLDRAVAAVGTDYVFSRKPSPAAFAEDSWHLEAAEGSLARCLERARDCRVEIIMKDISTVRYEPQRLWQWEQAAMRLVEAYWPR